jgi:hypothetical protein
LTVSLPRLQNFFSSVNVIALVDLLKLLLVKLSFYALAGKIIQAVSDRMSGVPLDDGDKLIGPILRIAFLKNVFVLANPHGVTNIKLLFRRWLFKVKTSCDNF